MKIFKICCFLSLIFQIFSVYNLQHLLFNLANYFSLKNERYKKVPVFSLFSWFQEIVIASKSQLWKLPFHNYKPYSMFWEQLRLLDQWTRSLSHFHELFRPTDGILPEIWNIHAVWILIMSMYPRCSGKNFPFIAYNWDNIRAITWVLT